MLLTKKNCKKCYVFQMLADSCKCLLAKWNLTGWGLKIVTLDETKNQKGYTRVGRMRIWFFTFSATTKMEI